MKRKMVAFLMAFVLAVTFAGCGGDEETTLTGMVVSVEGTVISLMEMDTGNMGGMDFAEGERPQMPEGMEGFNPGDMEGFEGFNPGDFSGELPEGETMPGWGEGEMPEGMEPPEGMTMPENGEMPDFSGVMPGFGGGMGSGFENFAAGAETKDVDIGDAHISVEIDGGKESGSLESIVPGAFVTITMNGKGEVSYVLVSARSGFANGGDGRQTS